jgi:hypothetical protein|tara:strand:+ start:2707 stop:2904 length:198 start_codon:yes stop_codon:yes gene_type:complete
MKSDAFIKVISIILGIGLASLFRQICKDGKCVIVKGPSINEVQKNVYKIDDKCYVYKPTATLCSS